MALSLLSLCVCLVSTSHAQELVDIGNVDPTIRVQLGYATKQNFAHEQIYAADARCLLRPDVAARLARVQRSLARDGLGLLLRDCYRPPSAQKKLWAVRPDPRYVADPQKGSRHGRGAAVDVTLVDALGHELEMPTAWDDATDKAHRGYTQLPRAALEHRARLEAAMTADGFVGLPTEWWHFDTSDWARYPQLDIERGRTLVPASTKQLVVVVAPTWSSHDATLTRYARTRSGWTQVGEPWAVVTGKGLAWGLGVHPPALATELGGAVKREGDRRSPAGFFRLTETTGYAADAPRGSTLPYRQASSRLYCVDDVHAPEYNRFALAPESGSPPWSSTEPMRRDDELYTRTVFVAHNPEHVRGAGSCIFLHVWSAPHHPTIGCTAMPLPELELLISWLKKEDDPLLVLLPKSAYDALTPLR
ncbi:MAG: M15 family metallopeptidase [Polyangia bacterium]